ncbi:hypothetical protein [Pukyongiella litopenaei]|uniref:Uncharacterized protein n=1 Tax=Pukyongiella litopenaei TaxID=2605946 RepID=A0A5C2H1V0_9RHOB|nr:hypothetical protein [Pukyongiella litopenaei]QEP30414.1 hypothetical protein C6Y53_19550 [Pukyongiella litopenaei]
MRAWDYPLETVTVACETCGRFGRYPKRRFIELVGHNTSLAGALQIIAKDCPHVLHGVVSQNSCGAVCPDLTRMKGDRPVSAAGSPGQTFDRKP